MRRTTHLLPCFLSLTFGMPLGVHAEEAAVTAAAPAVPAGSHDEGIRDIVDFDLSEFMRTKVTVASMNDESIMEASGTVYVINDEQIARFGWRNLREVLSAIPNMDLMWQWNWLTGGQRGYTGNFSGTLLMIDGREVQNLLASEAFINSAFTSHRIKRVEILQGPNSTLYGASALEGIINIVTKFGDEGVDTHEVVGILGEKHDEQLGGVYRQSGQDYVLGFSASYFTAQQNWARIADFAADTDRFSRDPSYDRYRYRGRSNFFIPEESYSMDAFVRWKSAYAGYDYFKVMNTQGIEFIKWDYNGDQSQRSFRNFFVGFAPKLTDQLSIKLEYRDGYEEDGSITQVPVNLRQNPVRVPEATSYDDLALNLKGDSFYDGRRNNLLAQGTYNLGDASLIILGYDYTRVNLNYAARLNAVRPNRTDLADFWEQAEPNRSEHSAFIQDTVSLWQHALKVTAGLRFTAAEYSRNGTTAKNTAVEPTVLPRASAIWRPTDASALKLTYGEGYRGPNAFELIHGSDKLPPLRKRMLEVNYTQQYNVAGPDLAFVNILAAYVMQAPNSYANTVLDNGNTYKTVAISQNQSVRGVEDMLTVTYRQLQFMGGLRYVIPDTQMVAGHNIVAEVPQFKGKLGVSYRFLERFTASAFVDHWSRVATLSNTLDGSGTEVYTVPAWTVVHANLIAGDFPLGAVSARLSLYVENIFNTTYYHANVRGASPVQYIQAPRNARLQASLTF